jgi:hypothetical protein
LEVLSYAITDLGMRMNLNMEDLWHPKIKRNRHSYPVSESYRNFTFKTFKRT